MQYGENRQLQQGGLPLLHRNDVSTPRSLVVSPGATRLISVALTVFHRWKLALGVCKQTFRTTPSVQLSGLSSDAKRASQYLVFAALSLYTRREKTTCSEVKKYCK